MEIAICVDFQGFLAVCEQEIRFRLFPRFEEMEASAFFRGEIDPFDIVVIQHWMDDGSDFDVNKIPLFLRDRDVFFHRRFHCARDQFLHDFPTARRIAADAVELRDDRAAVHAFKKLNHIFVSDTRIRSNDLRIDIPFLSILIIYGNDLFPKENRVRLLPRDFHESFSKWMR